MHCGDRLPQVKASPHCEAFPKRLRLRKRREFLAVQRSGRRVVTEHFIVYARPNAERIKRLGITVSTKVGHACFRNKIKRLLREAFRKSVGDPTQGFDFVFVARQETQALQYASVVCELDAVTRRLVEMFRSDRRRENRPRR